MYSAQQARHSQTSELTAEKVLFFICLLGGLSLTFRQMNPAHTNFFRVRVQGCPLLHKDWQGTCKAFEHVHAGIGAKGGACRAILPIEFHGFRIDVGRWLPQYRRNLNKLRIMHMYYANQERRSQAIAPSVLLHPPERRPFANLPANEP